MQAVINPLPTLIKEEKMTLVPSNVKLLYQQPDKKGPVLKVQQGTRWRKHHKC